MYSLCMKGNIYTTQRCPSCGGKMTHVDKRHNCVCLPCKTVADGGYYVKFGRDIRRRFSDYATAAQFLSGLRHEDSRGVLDVRDYRHDNQLAFGKQMAKWLVIKEKEVGAETLRKYKRFAKYANEEWKDRNVKTISFGDIQDFLFGEKFKSDKTRADARSFINHFFDWMVDREDIKKPKIPKVKFELGWRKITDLDTQDKVLAEVYRIAPQPKIAFGVEMLATYTSLRPDDLRRITEGDINGDIIRITRPTKLKNKVKIIRLIPEHVERVAMLRKGATALPHVPFFRHHNQSGVKDGSPYGKDLFYKWWKNACSNIGIEGLDLYGGTRHTTTTAIAEMTDEATAKQASGHVTNKAFDRYCQADNKAALEMAKMVRSRTAPRKTDGAPQVHHLKTKGKTAK